MYQHLLAPIFVQFTKHLIRKSNFFSSKDAIPILLSFVNKEQPTEKLVLCALVTLTNIAVLNEWHDEFYPVLHNLYHLVDSSSPQIKLQALKLLNNLSCNEEMVPSLLAAQVLDHFYYFDIV